MSYEWFISWRYLKAKRKQTFISLITWISIGGVAVGVMALIVVLAVMTGAQEDLRRKILGANSHIIVTHVSSFGISQVDETLNTIRAIDGVVAASPFITNQVILTSATRVSGVVLRGVDIKGVAQATDLAEYMLEGKIKFIGDEYTSTNVELDDLGISVEVSRTGIIIGKELALSLRVRMGDSVTVISPIGDATPAGMIPKSRDFFVSGIFSSGMYEYDSSLALISLSQAQSLFKMDKSVSGVEIKVKDIYQASDIAKEINNKLGYPYLARDWKEMNQNLFFALALEKTALGIILALIICVAAFNIVSTLIMVVMEKSKDIAILKAMGATRRSIRRIFIIEGVVIGVTGTILGDIGGILMCQLLDEYHFITLPAGVYNLETLPVLMKYSDIAFISLSALVITTLATLYPSWSASRLDPAESLRYE